MGKEKLVEDKQDQPKLVDELLSGSHCSMHAAATKLKEKGWVPQTLNDKVAFTIALELREHWRAVTRFGKATLPYLINMFSDESPCVRLNAAKSIAEDHG